MHGILVVTLVACCTVAMADNHSIKKRDMEYIKKLINSKLGGNDDKSKNSASTTPIISHTDSNKIKLIRLPGVRKIMIKNEPKLESSSPLMVTAIPEVATPLVVGNPTTELLGQFVRSDCNQTLFALQGIQNLLQSGVLTANAFKESIINNYPVPMYVPQQHLFVGYEKPVSTQMLYENQYPNMFYPGLNSVPFYSGAQYPLLSNIVHYNERPIINTPAIRPTIPVVDSQYSYQQIRDDGSVTIHYTDKDGVQVNEFKNLLPLRSTLPSAPVFTPIKTPSISSLIPDAIPKPLAFYPKPNPMFLSHVVPEYLSYFQHQLPSVSEAQAQTLKPTIQTSLPTIIISKISDKVKPFIQYPAMGSYSYNQVYKNGIKKSQTSNDNQYKVAVDVRTEYIKSMPTPPPALLKRIENAAATAYGVKTKPAEATSSGVYSYKQINSGGSVTQSTNTDKTTGVKEAPSENSSVILKSPPSPINRIENAAALTSAVRDELATQSKFTSKVNHMENQSRNNMHTVYGTPLASYVNNPVLFKEPMLSSYVYQQVSHSDQNPIYVPVGELPIGEVNYKVKTRDNSNALGNGLPYGPSSASFNTFNGYDAVPERSDYVYVPHYATSENVASIFNNANLQLQSVPTHSSFKYVTSNGLHENLKGGAETNPERSFQPTETPSTTEYVQTQEDEIMVASEGKLSTNPIVVKENAAALTSAVRDELATQSKFTSKVNHMENQSRNNMHTVYGTPLASYVNNPVLFKEPMLSSYVYQQVSHSDQNPIYVPVGELPIGEVNYKVKTRDNSNALGNGLPYGPSSASFNTFNGYDAVPERSDYVYVPHYATSENVASIFNNANLQLQSVPTHSSFKYVTSNGLHENLKGGAETNPERSFQPTETPSTTEYVQTQEDEIMVASEGKLSTNPIVVTDVGTYTYKHKQSNKDGSAITTAAVGKDNVAVRVQDPVSVHEIHVTGRPRGDIPDAS